MEEVDVIPLQIILENNDGYGTQYRNNSIVINTRSAHNFNKLYKEAVNRM